MFEGLGKVLENIMDLIIKLADKQNKLITNQENLENRISTLENQRRIGQ